MSTTSRSKGKIGVLIEDHFDEIEYREFNQYFPEKGYEVVYLSHLWGQPQRPVLPVFCCFPESVAPCCCQSDGPSDSPPYN